MMERAGYVQKTRVQAIDSDGIAHEVVEVHINGLRFAIRTRSLATAVAGKISVQIEDLTHNYGYYLGSTRGLGRVSASGKALNISLFHEGEYTLSLTSLRAVMYGKERNAAIVKIPEPGFGVPGRRVSEGQQQICATV